jgi:integrating conjugative element membrane protein (TIGR03745 family)
METIRNYGYDIVLLVALLVVASMFIGVCYHAYGTYAEIHTGRKTWGQFGLTVAIGAVLLVIGIWLLMMFQGFQNKWYKFPYAGEYAETQLKNMGSD